MDCTPLGSSVHEILQARILETVAILFSRRSFWPRDHTLVSCIGRWILYHLSPAKGFFKHATQHSAMAFCLTKGSKPKSFQGPAGCRCPLLPTRAFSNLLLPHPHPATLTPHSSLNTTGTQMKLSKLPWETPFLRFEGRDPPLTWFSLRSEAGLTACDSYLQNLSPHLQ